MMKKIFRKHKYIFCFTIPCIIVIALIISLMTYFLFYKYKSQDTNTDDVIAEKNNMESIEYQNTTNSITFPFQSNYLNLYYSNKFGDILLLHDYYIPSINTDSTAQTPSNKNDVIINEEPPINNLENNQEIQFKDNLPNYKYGNRIPPAININIPTGSNMKNFTDSVDTSEYKLLGPMKITGYTPGCVHCCGNDKAITASGVKAIAGYTVATSKDIPFGTTLYIEGYGYYVVEDRGVGSGVIDIACTSHDSCYNITNNEINVYIVPHK